MSTRRRLINSIAHRGNALGATPVDLGSLARSAVRRQPKGRLRAAIGGQTVLVTGASSGIGRATAVRCGRAGATVVLVARSEDALHEVADEIRTGGGEAVVLPCDLSDLAAVDALVASVRAAHGRVDVLVNNAGKSIRRPIVDSLDRFQDVERPMVLNYLAATRLTMGLLQPMIDRGRGQVINVSSWAVSVKPARFASYTASKAALEAWSDSVQSELLDHDIVFTNIRMPLVRTPMIAPTALYRRLPAMSADEAGRVVCGAMVDRSRRVTPMAAALTSMIDAVSPRAGDRVRGSTMSL